ncbi:hypothetical protein HDV05_005097 [Chytridiales sp. JEL 0842]|nr:hypothetical protein HDV05_005097 [Chytridiales sp. JEL 0842]
MATSELSATIATTNVQKSTDSKPTSPQKEDPTHASTPIHYPRVFLYLSLFLLPFALSITVLATNAIWKATVPVTPLGNRGLETFIGLDKICVGSYIGDSCVTLSDFCPATTDGERLMRGVSEAVCGSERKAAWVFAILGIVAGCISILSFVDNLLVWNNLSFWYHPNRHTVTEVRRVRIYFQEVILSFAALHFLFLLISVSLAAHLRGKMFADEMSGGVAELSWTFWVAVGAVVVDVVYVVLFIFMDQYTFFAVPTGRKFDPIDEA